MSESLKHFQLNVFLRLQFKKRDAETRVSSGDKRERPFVKEKCLCLRRSGCFLWSWGSAERSEVSGTGAGGRWSS